MWIKICGINDLATAQHVVDAGADALGLNFYAPSSRVVTPAVAAEIVRAVGPRITPVGLFVNHTVAEVREILAICPVTWLQFHGDETPEFLSEFRDFHLIKAFRCGPEGLAPIADYLNRCVQLDLRLTACLIDAAVPGHFGGTGTVADWEMIAQAEQRTQWPPLILAGGLTAENVAQGIAAVQPWGVDTASGVEVSKGIKDAVLIREFVRTARQATALEA